MSSSRQNNVEEQRLENNNAVEIDEEAAEDVSTDEEEQRMDWGRGAHSIATQILSARSVSRSLIDAQASQ